MGKWNETNEPIAFLITFRTYGTWLHGDERGSIDRFHNSYGRARAVPSEERHNMHAARLKSPPFLLDAKSRSLVDEAIRVVCLTRQWGLIAIAVRTNHVHVVISGDASAGRMLNECKAYSTRKLREGKCLEFEHSPWVDKGSKRYLWTEAQVQAASDYVVNGQGGPLPEL